MKRSYLALDLGAESGRAMLAHFAAGKIELTELHRFANTPVRLPTGLYWDTLRLFHEICEGIRAAAKSTERLDGIAVDTWGVDFGLLGADGSLLDNPRHYRDARTRGACEEVFAKVPRQEVFRQTGIQFMEINSLYQLHAIQRDMPQVLAGASQLLFMPDLFNYFLTGARASERTIASTSQFYNPVKKQFATDMLRRLGIVSGFLGRLIDPGMELGPVLPYVAERCDLKHEALVYTTGSRTMGVAGVQAGLGARRRGLFLRRADGACRRRYAFVNRARSGRIQFAWESSAAHCRVLPKNRARAAGRCGQRNSLDIA
jgi:rhamnulokinase